MFENHQSLIPCPIQENFNPADLLQHRNEPSADIISLAPMVEGVDREALRMQHRSFSSLQIETLSATDSDVDEITGMRKDAPPQVRGEEDTLTGGVQPRLVTSEEPNSDRYLVEPGKKVNGLNFDGVARIEDSFFGDLLCTGTLLPTGKHILTAGHCVVEGDDRSEPRDWQVTFELPSGNVTRRVKEIFLHPDYNSRTEANDIAIFELAAEAPERVPRYEIYRETEEIGAVHLKVGYGQTGEGGNDKRRSDDKKRVGFNVYDDFANKLDERFLNDPGSIPNGTQLAYDFDNGKAANDAFGVFFGINDTGLGEREVNSAVGDSGGPTFIDGKIAGITSYGFGANANVTTDIDDRVNSTFGEISVDTRISAYADWIDGIIGAPLETVAGSDFNGDGSSDLLLRNSNNGKNQIWLMDGGDRSSTIQLPSRNRNWEFAATGDFNGDGSSDLLLRNSNNGKNQIWLMEKGDRSSTINLPSRNRNWEFAAARDFNGDGSSDLLLRNSKNGKNQIWLMEKGDRSSTINLPSRNADWEFAATGDFNGDGSSDLLLRNSNNGKNQIWLMEKGDRSSTINLPSRNADWEFAATGDFNGDGSSDLLLRNSNNGNNQIWLMDEGDRSSTANFAARHPNWEILGTGDFDGDGSSDVLWRNSKNGKNQVWLLDGRRRESVVNLPGRANSWEFMV